MLKILAFYLIGNPKRVACGHPYLRKLLPFLKRNTFFKNFSVVFFEKIYRWQIAIGSGQVATLAGSKVATILNFAHNEVIT